MTIQEYNKLKQKVINLRQSALFARGEAYTKIRAELVQLEDLLLTARITDNSVEQTIISKLDGQDNSNIVQKPSRR